MAAPEFAEWNRTGEVEKFSEDQDGFLLELYRTRVANYNAQGQRLWTRFNYFLLMESAAFALHLYRGNPLAVYFGILLSIGWYLIAAQDHYFFREHRARIVDIERNHIIPRLRLIRSIASVGDRIDGVKTSWVSFGTKYFTVTHFSVYVPLAAFLLWLVFVIDRYRAFLPR